MELALIILSGILMGAFNFGFFLLGYYIRSKKKDEDAITVTEQNKDALKSIYDWVNYKGGNVNEN